MTEDDLKFIADEIQKEFGVPVEITETEGQSNRWAFYRLAQEYGRNGKGNPKRLLNKAVALELMGGECVLELKQMIDDFSNENQNAWLDVLKKKVGEIRQEMAEEVLQDMVL